MIKSITTPNEGLNTKINFLKQMQKVGEEKISQMDEKH